MLTLSIRYAFNPDKLGAYPFYFSERWAHTSGRDTVLVPDPARSNGPEDVGGDGP